MVARRTLAVGLTLAVVFAGLSVGTAYLGREADSPEPTRLAFTDVTERSGLDYEAVGSGVGSGNSGVYVADVNGDSWPDLLTTGGDEPALFVNDGGTFERSDALPPVDRRIKSAVFVDVEGDGWTDVLFFATDGTVLSFRNDGGTFTRTDYGLGELTYPLGASGADYDGDGDTDLFVYQSGSWRDRKPAGYFSLDERIGEDNGNENYLYENEDGTFRRVESAGITGRHWSLAASFADVTGDGYPDVHVANDYNNDTLYVNTGDGRFERHTLGGSTARNGMSSEVADVTGDGRPDVFVSNIWFPDLKDNMSSERYERLKRLLDFVVHSGRTEGNTLLVNRGDGEFVDGADELGVRHGGWGWAASATDFDNDGDRDLVHTTQVVVRVNRTRPVYTYPMVFQRRSDGFAHVEASTHGMRETDGRGMATLDFDHDGQQELVVATYDDRFVVYDNEAAATDAGSLQFRVVDDDGATALGAVVTVRVGGDEHVVQQTANVDYLSQDSRTEHVGVGEHEAVTLDVRWPDGTTRTFENVEVNRRLRIRKSGLVTVSSRNATA